MSDDSLDRDPFESVAESFLAKYRAGTCPDIEEYAARHPELADEIRRLLPALVMVEQDLSVDVDFDAEPLADAPVAAGSRRVGDYRILGEIGRGGMGVVYEAEQVSLGRRVALKVLPYQVAHDPKALERFRREARAAARLHHTNIVPVFEVGQDGETAYYAMQFIQGQGLDQLIDELARLRRRDAKPAGADRAASGRTVRASDGIGTASASASAAMPRGRALARLAESLLSGRLETEESRTTVGAVDEEWASGGRQPPVFEGHRSLNGQGSDARRSPGNDVPGQVFTSPSAVPPVRAAMATTPLSGRGRPFFRSVARIGRQAAQGLAYAHSRGVIHRDIKPSNLLLDHAGVVWITDFGLAKGEDEGLTQSGDILGTLRYMAPERLRGAGDARADIYSLGLTLYELLALRPAFETPDRLELIERIKTDEPARPRSLDVYIPLDLETIVLKAIDKDPTRRYATADAMAEDLRRFLNDESILARRASPAERSWRWARRNPTAAVLGGALTTVLLLATAGSLLFAGYSARLVRSERWERYRSNVAEASAAEQLRNSTTGERPLQAAPEEHRNWEWRHLSGQLEGARLVMSVPEIDYLAVRLSPDARQIAVGNFGGEVHLFDAATGRPGAVLRGHAGKVGSIEYSPDGRQLASGDANGTIATWDPATGRQQFVLHGGGGDTLLLYSPDGRRIVSKETLTGTVKGRFRLWDATTGRHLALLGESRRAAAIEPSRPMAFRPDGKRIVVAAEEFLRVCDAETGRQLFDTGPPGAEVTQVAFRPDGRRFVACLGRGSAMTSLRDGESDEVVAYLSEQSNGAYLLAFSPDGSRVAMVGNYPDNVVRLWETGRGNLIRAMAGHTNTTWGLRFSPDGKRLASASRDQTGRLWDGETGRQIAVLRGHTASLNDVTFSPDGTRLVTASDDRTLRLWDAGSGEPIAVLRGHRGRVRSPTYIPDGSRLISASLDDTVRVWDMKLVERNGVLRGHTNFVYDVAFRPDGKEVASAAWDGTVRLWDPDTGRQTALLRSESEVATSTARRVHSDVMESVVYSPDGGRLVTVHHVLGMAVWTLAGARRGPTWTCEGVIARAVFSPDGTLVAGGSTRGPVGLRDSATGERVAELAGHEGASCAVAFARDGATLVTGGEDGTVRLWDVSTRRSVAVLRGHQGVVLRVDSSPDGGLIASGSADSTVRLWDRRTHEALASINVGSVVHGVAFSPDGTRLAVGCSDTTIRLIDVAHRQEVAALRGHTDYVRAVVWSPDGTRLVSGSGDHTVRVWDSLSIQARARVSHVDPSHQEGPSRPL